MAVETLKKIRIAYRQWRSEFPKRGRKPKYAKKKPKVTNSVALVMAFLPWRKLDEWKTCRRQILAMCLKDVFCWQGQVNDWEFCVLKITPTVCLCNVTTVSTVPTVIKRLLRFRRKTPFWNFASLTWSGQSLVQTLPLLTNYTNTRKVLVSLLYEDNYDTNRSREPQLCDTHVSLSSL